MIGDLECPNCGGRYSPRFDGIGKIVNEDHCGFCNLVYIDDSYCDTPSLIGVNLESEIRKIGRKSI